MNHDNSQVAAGGTLQPSASTKNAARPRSGQKPVRIGIGIAPEAQPKKSMLDVILENQRKSGKTETVDRVMYVTKMVDQVPNRKDVQAWFDAWHAAATAPPADPTDPTLPGPTLLQQQQQQQQPVHHNPQHHGGGHHGGPHHHHQHNQPATPPAPAVTGIALLLQYTCLHIIEAPAKVILAHLRELQHQTLKSPAADRRVFSEIRIVASTEDVPFRAFPSWNSKTINLGRGSMFEVPAKDDKIEIEPIISECYLNLLQLGASLSELDKVRQKEAIESLRSKFRDLLPSDEKSIVAMLYADDTWRLSEFLELYDTPVQLRLENDFIWPIP